MSTLSNSGPQGRKSRRSAPEATLLALYAAVALTLFGSIGVGMAMSGGDGAAVTATDMHRLVLASR